MRVLAVFAFCSAVWAADRGDTEWKCVDEHRVALIITMAKARYAPMEAVDLCVVLKNAAGGVIYFETTTPNQQVDFRLMNLTTQQTVPRTLFGDKCCYDGPRYRTVLKPIPPGEAYRSEVNLNRLFDLSLVAKYGLSCAMIYLDSEKRQHRLLLEGVVFAVVDAPRPE